MRAILIALCLLVACAAPVAVPGPTPYDGLWDDWSGRYRAELIARCRAAGHVVIGTDPVRCLGLQGEYTP